MWPAGTAWSPIRGDVGLGAVDVAGNQAGVRASLCPAGCRRRSASGSGRTRHTGGVVTRPPPGSIPDAPGSYQFLDRDGRVLYVGKAKSLRHRLNTYFAGPGQPAARGRPRWSHQADHVEWIEVGNEVEALLLEYNLIKQHQPRFNVRLKDDKSYPWLAVTVDDEWPRPAVVRGRKRSGVRYFGPYAHAEAIRETLDLLLRTFPVRTCSRHQVHAGTSGWAGPACCSTSSGAPGRASARSTTRTYDRLVADLIAFLGGRHRARPRARAGDGDAGGVGEPSSSSGRSASGTSSSAVRKAADAAADGAAERAEDLDVFGVAEDELEAAVQVFHVRSGKVVGRLGLFVDKVEDLTPGRAHGAGPGRRVRRPRLRGAPAGPGAHHARRTPMPCRPTWPSSGPGRWSSGCPCGGPSGRCCRPWTRTPGRPSPATGCTGPRTTTAGPGPSSPCRTSSACPRPRCASSATT